MNNKTLSQLVAQAHLKTEAERAPRYRPVHKHDCNTCVYLATISTGTEMLDAYYHPSEKDVFRTVVLRHGDDVAEYWSMDVYSLQRHAGQPSQVWGTDQLVLSGMQLLAMHALGIAREKGLL